VAQPIREQRVLGYVLSDDRARVQLDVVHEFLRHSYWAANIPRDVVARSIAGSLCFGVYVAQTGEQVGFARVISDRATFAYLADVFVLEAHRGKGLSKALVAFVMSHPEFVGLRRWSLFTLDAHGLYAKFGFTPLPQPERAMEWVDRDVYTRAPTD
jgi:GNAT superfamily N-acetyltransferase